MLAVRLRLEELESYLHKKTIRENSSKFFASRQIPPLEEVPSDVIRVSKPLIAKIPKVELRINDDDWPNVHECVYNNDAQALCDILAKSSSPVVDIVTFVNKKGWSPLALALLCSEARIVNLLLDNGAAVDINKRLPSGKCPLHIACESGSMKKVQLLLQKGASKRSINEVVEYKGIMEKYSLMEMGSSGGVTPLHWQWLLVLKIWLISF